MKEQVLEQLRVLGFQPHKIEDTEVYSFSYEGGTYLYFPNQQEKHLLLFSVPKVVDKESHPDIDIDKLVNKVNIDLSYVKAANQDGDLWIYYEREVMKETDDDEMQDTIAKMIMHLDHSMDYAKYIVHEKSKDNKEEEQ